VRGCQLSWDGDGNAHLVQIARGQTRAPNLERLLADPAVLKLFHFGRFDIAALKRAFGVPPRRSGAPRSPPS
jgi:ribonuclease D